MEDTLSELTDVAIRMKEAFEEKNIAAFKALFVPKPAINVMGRFVPAEEFFARLAELLKQVEQPTIEILRVEETEVKKTSAFVSYVTEVSFIDEKAWEEHTVNGLLSLNMVKERETAAAKPKGREDRWLIDGLTFARQPDRAGAGEGPPSAGPVETKPTAGLFDGLFGIWY